MRTILLICLTSASAFAALPKPLFDGKTLTGWEGNPESWRVEDGVIVAGQKDRRQERNEFLCTTRDYGDFDLQVDYRRGGNNGGVQFHSQRVPGSSEMCGFQADFANKLDGFLYDESRRTKKDQAGNWIFLGRPDEETIARLAIKEWNHYHIRTEGRRIRLWVNGVQTVDYVESDPAIPMRGKIGLQVHKGATEIRYRALWIEELTNTTPRTAAKNAMPGPLFDGRTLSGWHYEGEPDLGAAAESTDGRYSAKDGVLIVNPEDKAKGPHLRQLMTIREFAKDFTLKLEFRAETNADSGIFIRGNQLQCRDYAVAGPPKYKALKSYRPGDWNRIEIVVRGTSARCTLNGEVMETAFKVPASGPIGLEADRGRLEYRLFELTEDSR